MNKLLVMVSITLLLVASVQQGQQIQAAENYPAKPIVYVVPVEAGAGGDLTARTLLKRAKELLGQPMIILNKPGAGSSIGYREIHDAKPDGYTIGMGMATVVTNKLQGILPFDYHDLTCLCIYANYNPILVSSTKTKHQFKTIQEVISYAKSHPGELSIAPGAVGQSWWIAAMAFMEATGIKLNVIPQAGAGAFSIAQVAGGHADIGMVDLVVAKPQIEAGNVRFLAIYGDRRAAGYDNVPTLKDVGYNIAWDSTHADFGPKNIPAPIVDRLASAFKILAHEDEIGKFLTDRGGYPYYLPPDKVIPYFDAQRNTIRGIMDKAGILKEK